MRFTNPWATFSDKELSTNIMGTPVSILVFKTFSAQILPVLEYGCEIWFTGNDIKEFESVQLCYL